MNIGENMAHYDCNNCGTYGGIDWGICKECTPEEYLKLQKEKEFIFSCAKSEWEKVSEKKRLKFIENYKKSEVEKIVKRMIELETIHKYNRPN